MTAGHNDGGAFFGQSPGCFFANTAICSGYQDYLVFHNGLQISFRFNWFLKNNYL
jgi:hypothetical protein